MVADTTTSTTTNNDNNNHSENNNDNPPHPLVGHITTSTVAAAPTSIITLNYTITLLLGKTGFTSAAVVNSAVLTLIAQVEHTLWI